MRRVILALVLLSSSWVGCGTSKWTDTQRTATEQLLISDAMDRAVSELDFRALAGKKVYLDTTPMKNATDSTYLTSTLRQHLLASGCMLKDKLEDADYVIEARAGSTGTDNHSLLLGVPQTTLPTTALIPGTAGSTAIPELPLAKKMEQRAIVKIGLFAYNRTTGRPVWQSGLVIADSRAKHLWVFGTGPFQRGEIYGGTKFAGDRLSIPLVAPGGSNSDKSALSVADEAYFIEPPEALSQKSLPTTEQKAPPPSPNASPAVQAPPPSAVMPAKHAASVDDPANFPLGRAPQTRSFSGPGADTSGSPPSANSILRPPYGQDNQPMGLYPATW